MSNRLHTTKDYHASRLETLGWELTVCNALQPEGSPLRKILRKDGSYGVLLSDHLRRLIPMEKIKRVIEIGGGYGFLMKDLRKTNHFQKIVMLDISPALLQKQREALEDADAEFRREDFFDSDPSILEGMDLAILNENLGDFPAITGLGPEFFSESEEEAGQPLKKARDFFRRYFLEIPGTFPFTLNLGALEAVEKICASGVPYIFLSEHSCEASVPEAYRRFLSVSSPGVPERISLHGHDEYTIKFSYLEAVARAFGYRTRRGPLAEFIPFDFSGRLRYILASRSVEKDEYEIIRHFVEDLYQYEYLLLDGRRTVRSGENTECRRCGKCCLADFAAYVTEEDIGRWRRQGREDILGIIDREKTVWAGNHFVSSQDERYIMGCHFLTWEEGRRACSIYETRPAVCRRFVPASSEICPQFKSS